MDKEPQGATLKRHAIPVALLLTAVALAWFVADRAMRVPAASPAAADSALTADQQADADADPSITPNPPPAPKPVLDKAAYDALMRHLAHLDESPPAAPSSTADTSAPGDTAAPGDTTGTAPAPAPAAPPKPFAGLWPVTNVPYPNGGAILPFHRIVAYYGNFYAKGMGVLGEYPEDEMLEKFRAEIKKWEQADPTTPVLPAIDYIAITAQGAPGKDGMYSARMPHDQIDKALALADKVNGIVILEVQAGFSDILTETKSFGDYLKNPRIHVAIDPEFAMIHKGKRPGLVVGTVDGAEVNAVAEYLAKIVRDNDLPPKVLIVHRYTEAMVTNYAKIKPLPEIQILMDMDGWGPGPKKIGTYNSYIAPQPVQFTGFKLFYKNDLKREGSRMLTPEEVLGLTPSPSFIQYQ